MSRRVPWRTLAAAPAISAAAAAFPARAEPAHKVTDGVYGRFDGDLDLSVGAGGAIVRGASGAAAVARGLFLGTAGIYVAYNEAFEATAASPPRSLVLGLGIRPLFLARWGNDLDRGPAVLDLTLDSITIDVGVLWSANEHRRFDERPGIEIALGTEVPILGEASGPWIGVRGALRWRAAELAASNDANPPLLPALFLTLGWHFIANAHIADLGDQAFR
jgi:hypothetical protein